MGTYITEADVKAYKELLKDNAEFEGFYDNAIDRAERVIASALAEWGGIVITNTDYAFVENAMLDLTLYYLNGQEEDKIAAFGWIDRVKSGRKPTGVVTVSDPMHYNKNQNTGEEGYNYGIW
jgi:hypothetical protein